MKNKVIIFVGPAHSGKSVLLNHYVNYWGGCQKVAYCPCYKPKILKTLLNYKAIAIEEASERDLFKLLDEVVSDGLENMKPIFVMMHDMPDADELERFDFVQVFEFTPTKCVYPVGESTELACVFSNASKFIENE